MFVSEGMPVKFKCCVDGQPMPAVQWFLNDIELNNSSGEFLMFSDLHYQHLFIPKCLPHMTGKLTFKATNSFGVVDSSCYFSVEGLILKCLLI